MVVQGRKYQTRLLACLFPYPCQIRSHHFSTRCIVSVFLLSRLTHRGDLRSAGISRLFATPLRLTGPHHSRRGHLLPSFYIGQDTRVLPLRLIPQELLVRRLPGYLPAVVQLDAVFDPGVSALCSSLSHSPHGLRLFREDRHVPNIQRSRGYVSDSGLHPSPRCSRLSSFPACAFSHYATGQLTNFTQEGLGVDHPSLSASNHCQVASNRRLLEFEDRKLGSRNIHSGDFILVVSDRTGQNFLGVRCLSIKRLNPLTGRRSFQ